MNKRVAFITGAGGGIGYHLANGYAQNGYQVIAIDRVEATFDNEAIDFYRVDLKSEQQIRDVFKSVLKKYGAVHVLINNGAISKFSKSIFELTTDEFDEVLTVNLRGSFICCKEFIIANKGQNYGRIINIASTRYHQNEADWEAYGASKGGLISLTNTLSVSLGETPITVNAISPGWIQVENYESLTVCDHLQHSSRRVGKPADIVNACLFLTQEENDFINGANLIIDGGMTKKMIYQTSDDFWSEEK
ncbi:MAG: SDR family NAD(P)-dependent oxidoreductase [Turicibacter sp.]